MENGLRDVLEGCDGKWIEITLRSGQRFVGTLSLDHIDRDTHNQLKWDEEYDISVIHLHYHFNQMSSDYFDKDYWIREDEIAVVEYAEHLL